MAVPQSLYMVAWGRRSQKEEDLEQDDDDRRHHHVESPAIGFLEWEIR